MVNPCAMPCAMLMNSQLNQSDAPSAASADMPMPMPTTLASTTVYSCWQMFPSISGSAMPKISLAGRPSVMFLTLTSFPSSRLIST